MSDRLAEARAALDAYRAKRDARPRTLFDAEARRIADRQAERDVTRAIERVTANALAHWIDTALEVVRELAAEPREFTVIDLRARLDDEAPHDWRALGGVLRQAQRAGWIEHTGRYTPGPAATHHCRPLAVWRGCPRSGAR